MTSTEAQALGAAIDKLATAVANMLDRVNTSVAAHQAAAETTDTTLVTGIVTKLASVTSDVDGVLTSPAAPTASTSIAPTPTA